MSVATLGYMDLIVSALVLVLAIKGAFNGFVREVVSLAAIIGGVAIASRVAVPLARWTESYLFRLQNGAAMELLAFLLTLLLIWGGVTLLGRMFVHPGSRLSAANRTLGYLVAGVKYFLIFSIITTVLFRSHLFRDNLAHQRETSRLYPILEKSGAWLMYLPPASIRSSKTKSRDKRPAKVPARPRN